MKKLLTLICTLSCVFCLTACGEEKTLTKYEQFKVDSAKELAVDTFIPAIQKSISEGYDLSIYTKEEIASFYDGAVDGVGFKNAVESFKSSMETVGEISEFGNATAKIDGDTVVVNVEVKGSKKDADIEVIISNDQFFVLKSAALNPKASLSDKMTKAGMNTLIGMGTVFLVLILISFLISLFKYIPGIVESVTKFFTGIIDSIFHKKKEDDKTESIDNTIQQIVEKEENGNDLAADLELVAVISAAIAAFEGEAGAEGYVVRSIRKVNRRA